MSTSRRRMTARSLLSRYKRSWCSCCGSDSSGGGGDGGVDSGGNNSRPVQPDSGGGDIPSNGGPERPVIIMGENKYAEIKAKCLRKGTLYEDPDFPTDKRSLFKNDQYVDSIEWKRPKEISGNYPKFIYGEKDYFDMDQGRLGNCWFVASVVCLAASPQKDLLKRVIPRDQGFDKSEYCGAFHFYFWQYGKWVEVVVDDRLPTLWGKLVYSSNRENPNEYWCPLLEKAYAKLNGSYHNIDGGRIFDSLVDLTGGIGELVPLKDNITSSSLKELVVQCRKMGSFIGAAIFAAQDSDTRETRLDNGLYQGHAYSIINVKEATSTKYGKATLFHVRNPWGRGEWNGSWSDRSEEFNTLTPENMKATMKSRNNGEFWISIEDFRQNFDELELCHLTPDAVSGELADNLEQSKWRVTEHSGSWVRGHTAGGPFTSFQSRQFWTNPQFELRLSRSKEKSSVIVSLFEIPSESEPEKRISIGFVIFKYLGRGRPGRISRSNHYNFAFVNDSGLYWPYRERTLQFVMEPAEYIIIPCTFAKGQQAEFYMRVFSELDHEAEPMSIEDSPLSPTTVNSVAPEKIALEEFNDLAGSGGVTDAQGLEHIFKKALGESTFSLAMCRSLALYAKNSFEPGMVNKEQFKRLWKSVETWRRAFQTLDKNGTGLMEETELNHLFKVLEFGDGASAVVEAIIAKYGGKEKSVTEGDFIQSFIQVLNLIELYKDLKGKRQLSMPVHEWLASVLLT